MLQLYSLFNLDDISDPFFFGTISIGTFGAKQAPTFTLKSYISQEIDLAQR